MTDRARRIAELRAEAMARGRQQLAQWEAQGQPAPPSRRSRKYWADRGQDYPYGLDADGNLIDIDAARRQDEAAHGAVASDRSEISPSLISRQSHDTWGHRTVEEIAPGSPWPARYRGQCSICQLPIRPGQTITHVDDGTYRHLACKPIDAV